MFRSALLLATIATAAFFAAPLPVPKPKKEAAAVMPRDADELLERLRKGGKPLEIAGGWTVAAERVEGRVLHGAILMRKGRDGRAEVTVEAREAGVPVSMTRGEVTILLRFGGYVAPDSKGLFAAKEMTLPLAPGK